MGSLRDGLVAIPGKHKVVMLLNHISDDVKPRASC